MFPSTNIRHQKPSVKRIDLRPFYIRHAPKAYRVHTLKGVERRFSPCIKLMPLTEAILIIENIKVISASFLFSDFHF